MVKGNQREESKGFTKYVGFTKIEVVAVNPSTEEINKLTGRESKDDDKEKDYVDESKEGNRRVRLEFWLKDVKTENLFKHKIYLTDKVRKSNDETKTQYVNSTCNTGWAEDEEGLADWFTNFQNKDKENIATKKVKPALVGEEELVTFVRAWLGRLNWSSEETEVIVNTEALFNDDYNELRSLIGGDFDAPFVIMLGVETDENDSEKQYQKVWKEFLPGSFMDGINKGMKFTNEYQKKTFGKFEENLEGQYGFKGYYEVEPLKEYDKTKDVALAGNSEPVTPKNSKY